jgi:hypothetical protein
LGRSKAKPRPAKAAHDCDSTNLVCTLTITDADIYVEVHRSAQTAHRRRRMHTAANCGAGRDESQPKSGNHEIETRTAYDRANEKEGRGSEKQLSRERDSRRRDADLRKVRGTSESTLCRSPASDTAAPAERDRSDSDSKTGSFRQSAHDVTVRLPVERYAR